MPTQNRVSSLPATPATPLRGCDPSPTYTTEMSLFGEMIEICSGLSVLNWTRRGHEDSVCVVDLVLRKTGWNQERGGQEMRRTLEMKWFHLSTDGDPDLNLFDEIDVERDFLAGSRKLAENITEIDSLQRWMRDARPGDTRPLGATFIVCVEP